MYTTLDDNNILSNTLTLVQNGDYVPDQSCTKSLAKLTTSSLLKDASSCVNLTLYNEQLIHVARMGSYTALHVPSGRIRPTIGTQWHSSSRNMYDWRRKSPTEELSNVIGVASVYFTIFFVVHLSRPGHGVDYSLDFALSAFLIGVRALGEERQRSSNEVVSKNIIVPPQTLS